MTYAHAPLRRLRWPAALAAVLALALLPAAAAARGPGHDNGNHYGHGNDQGHGQGHGHFHGRGKAFDTMTRNLYLGADLNPAIAAKTPEQLTTANGQILHEVVHNDFPTRAKGLAAEILSTKPDLVGLQEVANWTTTPLSAAATPIEYDYLELLMDQLNSGPKPRYRVVVVQEEFDLESPADYNGVPNDGPLPAFPNAEQLGHLTMRDVILARRGAGIRTWNEQGGNFATLLEVPVLGQALPIKRGWTATDAKVRGSHPFRFVNTHLEAFEPHIRAAQAQELVAPGGPATSSLPVVLVGDLNSDDDTVSGDDRLAYEALLAAGMVERSTDDPLSCCIDSPLLGEEDGGSVADFDHQVDHIMTRDPEEVLFRYGAVTGLLPVNGFWDSDHAGLFSALRFRIH